MFLSENLIEFKPYTLTWIPIFDRTNKGFWLEKKTAIRYLEIATAGIPIEMKTIQVDDENFKEYQKEDSHI